MGWLAIGSRGRKKNKIKFRRLTSYIMVQPLSHSFSSSRIGVQTHRRSTHHTALNSQLTIAYFAAHSRTEAFDFSRSMWYSSENDLTSFMKGSRPIEKAKRA